jgi:CTP synthase
MAKFIFITGGVVSSLGKGICAASLASLLKCHGYKVRLRKLDPYLNVDPGTMSPTQHGEVFVTEDGAETDLDLGHYERFTGNNTKKSDNVTAGQIYQKLLRKERKGDYLGGTVQVIPHVTNLIKDFIQSDITDEDFIICEIGGTVGDIEGLPFFEAIRQLGNDLGRDKVLYIHVTLVPYIKAAKELKSKPTQHSVKELRSIGITPNILICRSERYITKKEKDKIALFCNLDQADVIQAIDKSNIYQVPLELQKQGLDSRVLKFFNLEGKTNNVFANWQNLENKISQSKKVVNIAVVGKYTSLSESYKSIIQALDHAGYEAGAKINIKWVDARKLENTDILDEVDGILVPGAFGVDGSNGKISAIKYARINNKPFFGICYGMQMAIIEFAQNVLKLDNSYSSEFNTDEAVNGNQIVGLMTEWDQSGNKVERNQNSDLGGTMRLGSYPCRLKANSLAAKIYGQEEILERHRHRYEVNIKYKEQFEANGLEFSGLSPDGKLPEIMEINNHPFFLAVQFHPEFKSRPMKPHPVFQAFVNACLKQENQN